MARFIARSTEFQNAAWDFSRTWAFRPDFSHQTSSGGLSPMRTSQGGFIRMTAGNTGGHSALFCFASAGLIR